MFLGFKSIADFIATKLNEKFATKNACYKSGKKLTVRKLTLHSVGCAQPSAYEFATRWNVEKPGGASKCVHAFISAGNGDVWQILPWDMKGWHGGSGKNGSVNSCAIGVEMCESGHIKYISSTKFEVLNKTQAQMDCTVAYNSAVLLFAYLCQKYKLNPLTDIISHKEGYALGIASDHGDPEHYWKGLGMSYTMDGFRRDVKSAMTGNVFKEETVEAKPTTTATPATTTTTTKTTTSAPTYKVGNVYTLQVELKVRTGAGTNYSAKKHSQLTSSGQTHDVDKDGALDKGTKVTCKEIKRVGNDIWMRCPSGWIAAYYSGKVYVK